MPAQVPDNIYWAFSAAAQALAAVVAFLLAGYALVHSMMESRAAADDTLSEINNRLSLDYHRRLTILVILTIAAIIVDLLVVYFNSGSGAPAWSQWLAAILTICAFIGAILFVIPIVDPARYQKTARRMVQRTETEISEPQETAAAFFTEYVSVEQLLRRLWIAKTDGERLSRRPGPPTVREMVESLRLAQVLPEDVAGEIASLSQIRNLVFHGQIKHVEARQVEQARWVRKQLEQMIGTA